MLANCVGVGCNPTPLTRRSAATISSSTAETIVARKNLSIPVNPEGRESVPAKSADQPSSCGLRDPDACETFYILQLFVGPSWTDRLHAAFQAAFFTRIKPLGGR